MDLRQLILPLSLPGFCLGLACGDARQAVASEPSPQAAPMSTESASEATLEDGVVLLYEKISLGNEPEANRRWLVRGDGQVLFSKNRPPVPRGTDFNTELTPLGQLDPDGIARLLQQAREAGFWQGERHLADDSVEDGMRQRLTIREGDEIGLLVADNVDSAVMEQVAEVLAGVR